ncbi:MAG: hypothetical protein C4334_06330 [Pyrinomonas sp.]
MLKQLDVTGTDDDENAIGARFRDADDVREDFEVARVPPSNHFGSGISSVLSDAHEQQIGTMALVDLTLAVEKTKDLRNAFGSYQLVKAFDLTLRHPKSFIDDLPLIFGLGELNHAPDVEISCDIDAIDPLVMQLFRQAKAYLIRFVARQLILAAKIRSVSFSKLRACERLFGGDLSRSEPFQKIDEFAYLPLPLWF